MAIVYTKLSSHPPTASSCSQSTYVQQLGVETVTVMYLSVLLHHVFHKRRLCHGCHGCPSTWRNVWHIIFSEHVGLGKTNLSPAEKKGTGKGVCEENSIYEDNWHREGCTCGVCVCACVRVCMRVRVCV